MQRFLTATAAEEDAEPSAAGGPREDEEDAVQPSRATGLNSLVSPRSKSLHAPAVRKSPAWKLVTVLDSTDARNPLVKCMGCGHQFKGGASRIASHALGINRMVACSTTDGNALEIIEEIRAGMNENQAKKQRTQAVKEVNLAAGVTSTTLSNKAPDAVRALSSTCTTVASASSGLASHTDAASVCSCTLSSAASSGCLLSTEKRGAPASLRQSELTFETLNAAHVDQAVSRFFYGCNIPAAIISHPLFIKMCLALRVAPRDSYRVPDRRALYGHLLDRCVGELRVEEKPLREIIMRDGATIVSDGWDTIDKHHLINFLLGTCKGFFFEGTIQLSSSDHEDAQLVAGLLSQCIERNGALAVVQICTDTCSVMKAAWRILRDKYPYITTTCCAAHVLSLELKDFAKISEIAEILRKSSCILRLFWGRKRWPRNRLRELIASHHHRNFGLYRAKPTRFAGRYRELARLLRVKSELQQVVVDPEYARQKFDQKRGADGEDDDELHPGIGVEVKRTVLDEDFWTSMVSVLRISLPIIKLLRLTDGNTPVIGKVYDRMFLIEQKLQRWVSDGTVPWASTALEKHRERWEYLHSDMHAAGYALDPEFLETVGEIDSATQDGLTRVIEKMCLRDVMLSTEDEHARALINETHPEVVKRIAQAERELSAYQTQAGALSRPATKQNAKILPPADWWALYGKTMPMLCAIAKTVLAQPVSASVAERNWSVYGSIRTERRTRLHHHTADKLVYAHEALALHAKLQDAGFQPEVEKWLSDSESDDSDGEADLDLAHLMQ